MVEPENDSKKVPASRSMHWEFWLVLVLGWLAFVAVPLSLGQVSLGWDALNHHIYLGWNAEHSRLTQDFWAASSQSYQYPYTYWPVYKMAVLGWSGLWAGVVLSTINALVVPPVWMVARVCIPGQTAFDVLMRLAAVTLACLSGVVLALLDATQNDLTAAIPLVWAFALALWPLRPGASRVSVWSAVVLAGLFAGVSVAIKLSSGPLAILMPLLWLNQPAPWTIRLRRTLLGCGMTIVGYTVAYAPWGWQLWHHFGNPIYPLFDSVFAPLRDAFWRRPL